MKSVLFYSAAVALISSVFADPIRVPLHRYNKRHHSHDYIAVPADNLMNGMMGGTISIGNPPQNFTVAFDTSTGFSWVRGPQCGVENCEDRKIYDPRQSSTAISSGRSFSMDYGEGFVNTTLYRDTFRFAGLEVKNMTFGAAYMMEYFDKGFDGYLGLGRNVNMSAYGSQFAKRDLSSSSFVPNAFQQSSGLSSAQFGMYTTTSGNGFSDSGVVSGVALNGIRDDNYSLVKRNDEPDGYLILGGVAKDVIRGKLYHMDIDDDYPENWAVPVSQVSFVGENNFKVHKHARAVFSSSTDVIGLPNDQAAEFQKHWYAEYDKPDNTFKIPCCLMERLPNFKITLGDVKITLPPRYWSHPRPVTSCCEMCRSHIGKSESDTDYVIGSALTNSFYTQFNSEKNTVSLGIKKNQIDDGLRLSKA
ncbi:aspartic peptidase domain-containing protein [Mycotypha africana]|uniref:aspartic peptidase domain-containing protein n=1 Tax=Mycotypha africana TaxID=64632 RepID=UPI002301D34D|nr:aspartic peptidase domain-containing protein [Mycotypha africana]KAI8975248.1 aspartic peptidase domain-containing protein [Mycotypha africana]